MPAVIVVRVDEKLYLKNPEDTPLGRKIVSRSVELMDVLGYEKFTIKRLADDIGSTEASVYRYFESKQHLMNYLVAWYWGWLEMRVHMATINVPDSRERMRLALGELTAAVENDPAVPHIDESILHRVVVNESGRALTPRQVDTQHAKAVAQAFDALCSRITAIVQAVRPDFEYPRALTLTLIATTHRQRYYSEHFPEVTDLKVERGDPRELSKFLNLLASSVLS